MANDRNFVATSIDQIVHEVASPLIAHHMASGEIYACGTAFIIGPGLALTAYHVIEDFVHRFERADAINSSINVSFELLMYLTLNEGNDIMPIKVLKIWRNSPLDMAVLAFAVPTDWPDSHVWKAPRLQLLPPKPGESIAGFGFATPKVSQAQDDIPEIDLSSRTTTGTVVEIHHQSRDKARLSFPCFRVDARFDGSMSGGPIFNSAGNLCGLICSSLPATEEHPEHISYACTLWPILGTLVDACEFSTAIEDQYPLAELFDCGKLHAVDRSSITVTWAKGSPVQTSAQYNAGDWE